MKNGEEALKQAKQISSGLMRMRNVMPGQLDQVHAMAELLAEDGDIIKVCETRGR